MLNLTLETEVGEYRLPDDPTWTGGDAGSPFYHLDLVTPPKRYAESAVSVLAVFPFPLATARSGNVISFATGNKCVYWPSYSVTTFNFDATSGAFIGRAPSNVGTGLGLITTMYVSRDDSLFVENNAGGWYEIDPLTWDKLPGTDVNGGQFGTTQLFNPMWDKGEDRLVATDGQSTIRIHKLSDKSFVASMKMTEQIIKIFPADERRAYVRTVSNLFVLIDYVAVRVLGVVRVPGVFTGDSEVSFDWRRRRFMVVHKTPDAVDGACTMKILCYYPVPVATDLIKPIPLASPRKGRTVPVWTRAIGDVGEGVGGRPVAVTVTGGTLQSGLVQTGADGSAQFNVLCDDSGSLTVDCSVEVL